AGPLAGAVSSAKRSGTGAAGRSYFGASDMQPPSSVAAAQATQPALFMRALPGRAVAVRIELVRIHLPLSLAALEDAAHDDEEDRHEEHREQGGAGHPAHHAGA